MPARPRRLHRLPDLKHLHGAALDAALDQIARATAPATPPTTEATEATAEQLADQERYCARTSPDPSPE